MKYLLTGDFHVKKGIFTNIILDYLDYIRQYSLDNDIKNIIIMGDIFDKSSNIKNEAFVPLFMKFYDMKMDGIKFYFILGNHDIYSVNNDSIVETFKPLGFVIKQTTYEDKFSFMPYTRNEEDIPETGDILFTHIPIADFSFDNAYHATEKHAFRKELFSQFNIVFTGHFHRHQHDKNIVYTGSPVQLNFGEEGQKKGFVIFDSVLEDWEFVEYKNSPKFVRINLNDFQDFNPINKFVGVKIDAKIENFIKLKRILLDKGAIDVVPFFERKEDIEVGQIDNLKEFSSIKDTIREYISKVEEENIDNKKLLKIFEKVLEA